MQTTAKPLSCRSSGQPLAHIDDAVLDWGTDEIHELIQREKAAGVEPDWEVSRRAASPCVLGPLFSLNQIPCRLS